MKLVTDCFKVFSVILVLLTAGPLAAQTEAEAPKEPMTAGEINSMVARMSDDEVRALLLERLDAVEESEAAEEPLGPVAQLERLWSAFTFPLRRALAVLPQVPQHQAAAHRQLEPQSLQPGLASGHGAERTSSYLER